MVNPATHRPNTKGYAKIIAALTAGPTSVVTLSQVSGLRDTSVRNYLNALRSVEPSQVFIEEWGTHPDSVGIKFPKYRLGTAPDAPKPKPLTPKQMVARRAEQRVEARRQKARGGFSMTNSIFNYTAHSGDREQ